MVTVSVTNSIFEQSLPNFGVKEDDGTDVGGVRESHVVDGSDVGPEFLEKLETLTSGDLDSYVSSAEAIKKALLAHQQIRHCSSVSSGDEPIIIILLTRDNLAGNTKIVHQFHFAIINARTIIFRIDITIYYYYNIL